MLTRPGVVGGGTMGHGIAAAFALAGCDVALYEPAEAQRERVRPAIEAAYALLAEEEVITSTDATSALARIRLTDNLAAAVHDRDFVVEAIPERMDLKQKLFAELDRLCPPETIFASNTSSLPLAEMMAGLPGRRRARMMVTHWYNPPLLMPIVELSFFGNMAEALYAEAAALHEAAGKQVVKVLKDVPGLVANRIQQGVAREVFSLIEQGVATPEDIDKALKFGPAFRYATTGQLEVADFGGLDVWCTVGDNLLAVMDDRRDANPLLRRRVAEGKLGVKSGEGFYRWDADTVPERQRAFMKRLIHQLKASRAYA
ncbi:3-hydroxybutyryl-CoA dehydrogenase [uncultured Pleomorphomonas sp.]|uniref:3-hydroxybutyryl-CoA dehydrogenase n=1 Tax=uncultured Pleomorphomonas sp. TaxID=442121 RepID=A0A212LMI3_9HYPH|nr:3-hydroxyacyl-CoA dehydrogenase NAD-binding domain-containing protein [uncultured Pleomorphomonas sp.]SCM78755.1 3-hydroxybutyryl-CoA dehydrogenase [uncultured Pleomorphomonas sp.]